MIGSPLDPDKIMAEWPEALDDPAVPVIRALAAEVEELRATKLRVRELEQHWRQVVINMSDHNKASNLHFYLEGRADDLVDALDGAE